jgi:uncharacterized RDD family membrane protein YckC
MTQSGQPGSTGQPSQPGPQPPTQPSGWQQAPTQPTQPAPPPPPAQRTQVPAWTGNLTSTTPVAGPAGYYYADVPNRVIAYIIDIIILAIIGFIVTLITVAIFGPMRTTTINGTTENLGPSLVSALLGLAISAAYFVYLWSAMRGTVGMKVLGLQIGDERDGRSITYQQGFIRWLIIGIPGILATFAGTLGIGLGFLLSLVGVIWLIALLVSIAQSPTKQGYQDRYAHTIMVKAARQAA